MIPSAQVPSVSAIYPARVRDSHFPALDWLRFLAALTVCWVHVRNNQWGAWADLSPDSQTPLAFVLFFVGRLGHEAVLVFFVLSGYLVGGPCWQRARTGAFSPGCYAIDRATRIYPAYAVALLLSAAADLLTGFDRDGYTGSILGMFVFQHVGQNGPPSNAALWSIDYEAWFYVFAGSMAALGRPKTLPARLSAAGMLILSVFLIGRADPHYLVCWTLGACAWRVLDRLSRPLLFWTGTLTAVSATLLRQLGETHPEKLPCAPLAPPLVDIIIALGVAAALPALSSFRLPAGPARAGVFLAAFSYSLYLIHLPLLHLWSFHVNFARHAEITFGNLASAVVIILILLICAWLFHLLFERPASSLRAKLKARLLPAPLAPASP